MEENIPNAVYQQPSRILDFILGARNKSEICRLPDYLLNQSF